MGSIFSSANTIRIIQASSFPNIRDSVPPTSALRFDPSSSLLGKKRDRVESPNANGTAPSSSSNSFKPNKRQRVSDLDPDQALPSLEEEEEAEIEQDNNHIVPNSQESVILGDNSFGQVSSTFHHVLVAATPSPPPSLKSESDTDTFTFKFTGKRRNRPEEIQESSQERGEQRSQSRSLAVNGFTEIGVSATSKSASPLIIEQAGITNGFSSSSRRISSGVLASGKANGHRAAPRSKESIYDQIVTGDEGASFMRNKKSQKKNSPPNGTFSTPTSARRLSREDSTPKQLDLTPQSLKHVQRQREEADEARKARLAGAEAAEQRRREADEARELEEASRITQEEADRIKNEELKRNEAAKIAREKKEREAEEQRLAEEQAVIERLAEKVRAERSARETAEEEENAKRIGTSPLDERRRMTSSPLLSRAVSGARAQSSTPFIPTGRKSSLKSSSINGSSPAPRRLSSTGVSIDDNMPLPSTRSRSPRRVSFIEGDLHDTPVRSESKNGPRKPSTPHPAASQSKGKGKGITPGSVPAKTITPVPVSSKARGKTITPSTSKIAAPGPNASKAITPTTFASKIVAPSPKPSRPRSSKSVTPDMAPPKKAITSQPTKSQVIIPSSSAPPPAQRSASGAILPPARAQSKILPPGRPVYRSSGSDRSFSPQVPVQGGRVATSVMPPAVKKTVVPTASQSSKSVIPPPGSKGLLEAFLTFNIPAHQTYPLTLQLTML